ncbi:MAG: enoyl-CoA hydratase [Pseudomonadota bacterium]
MSDDLLSVAQDGRVRWITMNRPDARNALSLAMLAALDDAIAAAGADAGTHVIVLAAAGPVFCAGHDLKELTQARGHDDKGQAFFTVTMERCAALMQNIVRCPKPVIAAVQGTATAAGCQLVATCDLAVASEGAKFATPGVHIGLFCSTPMVALSRNVGRKQAMEMLLTGVPISAAQAVNDGLINRAVPAVQLNETVADLAETIASKSPRTVKIGKEAFYRQAEMPLAEAYKLTAQVMVANMLDADAKEGIDAFIEKRPASWQPLREET